MELEEAKRKIDELRSEAHEEMDHSLNEDHYESGKFEAYTKAKNIINRVDEIKVKLE